MILALTPKDCQNKRWHPPQDLSFASHRALLPIHAGELAKTAAAMPLAVVQQDGQWQLVAVCGQQSERNLYILSGQWQGMHQPECLSTWPLRIYTVGDKGFAVLDTDSGVLSSDDSGEPFFTADGKPATALAQRLELLPHQHQMQTRTAKALQTLADANLFTPWPQALCQQAGVTIDGLHMIDEQALVKLPDDDFLKLRQALPLAYAINFSIQQLHMLARLARLHPQTPATQSADLDALFGGGGGDTISFGF